LAALAGEFVLARVTNMRGVDLNVFQFDYDLTWYAFFLDADQRVFGRYGGRGEGTADEHLSIGGLKHAMRSALTAFSRDAKRRAPPPAAPPKTPEQYPAAKRLRENACIHCHYVWDFRRAELQATGKWARDDAFVYPPPETIGVTIADDRGDRVTAVTPGSPADRAGLRAGDELKRINDLPVASYADVQHGLHMSPAQGRIPVNYSRGGREQMGALDLPAGWRASDISWRPSMWGLSPAAALTGSDLSDDEKEKLGLAKDRLAFRQSVTVSDAAKLAGVRAYDVILGFAGRDWPMNARQFNAFVRLNYAVGDRVTVNILRDGKRLALPMTLPDKP
jgi:serine protease Do